MGSLYDELDLDPSERYGDTVNEKVKANYRRLLLMLHPDRGNGNNTDRLMRVISAYRVLSDPVQKARYDQSLDGTSPTDHHHSFRFDWKEAVLFMAECIPLEVDWEQDILVRVQESFSNVVGRLVQVQYVAKRHRVVGNVVLFDDVHVSQTVYVSPDVDYELDYLTVRGCGNDVVHDRAIHRGDLLVEVMF